MMNRAVRVVVAIGNVRTDAGSLVEDTRNTVTNATAGAGRGPSYQTTSFCVI